MYSLANTEPLKSTIDKGKVGLGPVLVAQDIPAQPDPTTASRLSSTWHQGGGPVPIPISTRRLSNTCHITVASSYTITLQHH